MEQGDTEIVPKKREYLFDNYKALLILLVVVSHFIEPNYKNNPILYGIKWFIVSFHMPAFIFVSGYFSKKPFSLKKVVRSLVIPYFVYEVIYFLLYTFVLHKETKLYLTRPKFSLWYLMGLFAWKLMACFVKKIPGHFWLSIIAGLLIGLCGLGNFLSIPRILFFFPFFLAGMHFEREQMERFRTRNGRIGAILLILGVYTFLLLAAAFFNVPIYIFYGRYSYHGMQMENMSGMLVRAVCYLLAFLLLYAIMILIPDTKKRYSYIGQRTMPVYIFHGLIYSCFHIGTEILETVHTNMQCFVLIMSCVLLVWLLALKPFVKITDKISHLV